MPHVTADGANVNPSAKRSYLGKLFNQATSAPPFENIIRSIDKNGKPKLTVSNRAAVYKILG